MSMLNSWFSAVEGLSVWTLGLFSNTAKLEFQARNALAKTAAEAASKASNQRQGFLR